LADSALVRETACPSSAEIDFEAVAALRPDLITGVSSGMTAEEYETLSRIAPTVTQTDEYAAHPEWEGREAVVSYVMSESEIGAYASQDIRGQLMTGLGFPTPPEIDELAGDQFFSSFSLEEVGRLDRDLIVWIGLDARRSTRCRAGPRRSPAR
jgi:iron complex transport system substrate-binding protein